MIIACHLAAIGVLCLLQTVVLSHTFLQTSFYDLFCPFIVYLSIFRPLRETIPTLIVAGLVMDSFSGGPAGLYLTAYLWVWIGTRLLITWLYAGNPLILLCIVSLGVILENGILFLLIVLFTSEDIHSAMMFNIMLKHFIWAVLTGPSVLLLIKFLYDKVDLWRSQLVAADTSYPD